MLLFIVVQLLPLSREYSSVKALTGSPNESQFATIESTCVNLSPPIGKVRVVEVGTKS